MGFYPINLPPEPTIWVLLERPESDPPWTLGPPAGPWVGRTWAVWSGLLPGG